MGWHKWKPEEEEYLKTHWNDFSNEVIARHIGVTVGAAKKKARSFKLVKSKEAVLKILKDTINPTVFKKGNLPHNTKSDNCITTRVTKTGAMYQWIRLALGNWQMLHVYNWLEVGNSYDPKAGDVLRFIDGNTLNADPSNIKKITRSVNLQLNYKPRRSSLEIAVAKRESTSASRKARRQRDKQLRENEQLAKRQQRLDERHQRIVAFQRDKVEREKNKTALKEQKLLEKQRQSKNRRAADQRHSSETKKPAPSNMKFEERKRRQARELPQFSTKQIDYSQMMSIKVDSKTYIWIPIGSDIVKAKEKFWRSSTAYLQKKQQLKVFDQ